MQGRAEDGAGEVLPDLVRGTGLQELPKRKDNAEGAEKRLKVKS